LAHFKNYNVEKNNLGWLFYDHILNLKNSDPNVLDMLIDVKYFDKPITEEVV
jgi:hypothetical protein